MKNHSTSMKADVSIRIGRDIVHEAGAFRFGVDGRLSLTMCCEDIQTCISDELSKRILVCLLHSQRHAQTCTKILLARKGVHKNVLARDVIRTYWHTNTKEKIF